MAIPRLQFEDGLPEETGARSTAAFHTASRSGFGWYLVTLHPDGRWSAEHSLLGPLGLHPSKEAAIRECEIDDAKRGG